jgi:NADPH:quinone reductase-like Zn-dependent oxidoreductase
MNTMKAARIHAYGAADELHYEDAPRPAPAAGEVLVKVMAAGINPVDWKTRSGKGVAGRAGNPLPLIVGWDISGVVESVGEGATAFKPGDEVFGMARFPQIGSAYAQYVAAPESDLARKPANIDHVQAAAIPLAALTAWQGLFELANVQPGQRVLVTGATGGVGHLAVQLAKWKGAYVIGTASTEGLEFARSFGPDEVIDYTNGPLEASISQPVDLVFNSVSPDTATQALAVLKEGGHLVTIAGTPDEAAAAAKSVTVSPFLVHTSGEQMQQIADLMANGSLRVAIHQVLPLSKAAEAHRIGEAGHLRGKLVLAVEHDA